jgi:hypothetical protein
MVTVAGAEVAAALLGGGGGGGVAESSLLSMLDADVLAAAAIISIPD